jgi:hypothetical protein
MVWAISRAVFPTNPLDFKLPRNHAARALSLSRNPELGTENQLAQRYESLRYRVLAGVPEWSISTVSRAALERTISSFDTVLRAPFEAVGSLRSAAKGCLEMAERSDNRQNRNDLT